MFDSLLTSTTTEKLTMVETSLSCGLRVSNVRISEEKRCYERRYGVLEYWKVCAMFERVTEARQVRTERTKRRARCTSCELCDAYSHQQQLR